MPLSFAPGTAYRFDWSHECVVIDGVTTMAKVVQIRLCHSRMLFVRAYPGEAQEMVFDAHEKAFQFFKGAARRGIYDNMRTAVDAVFVGKERRFNRRFLQLMSHHLVEPTACMPAAGWEKGQVWRRHRQDVDGSETGDAQVAWHARLNWEMGFHGEDFAFPDDERLGTRLGDLDLAITFPEGIDGPFGRPIQRLSIPGQWVRPTDGRSESCGPAIVSNESGRIEFSVLGSRFSYDRFGFNVTPARQ